MSDKGIFPSKTSDLNDYITIAVPYVTANTVRFAVSATNQSSLTTLYTNANVPPNTLPDTLGLKELWLLYSNPATRLKTITDLVRLRTAALKTLLRVIYADIPESKLTATDRNTLNLKAHSHEHSPAPVPPNAPSLVISGRGHLYIILTITDPANPHTQAKPDGVAYIEIEHAFQSQSQLVADAVAVAAANAARKADPGLPAADPVPEFPQESDFHHLADTGKFLYKTTYTQDQVGGVEYIRARYVNSRKEPGDWSVIIAVIIS